MKQLDFAKIEGFEWDKANIDKNWKKHKVYYKEAEEIFSNEPLIIIPDIQHSQVEQRFIAHGKTNNDRKITVVFTIRNYKFRVISAREQNQKEKKQYEKKTKTNS